MSPEKLIVFGQVFKLYNDERLPRFVVTDTSPKNNPESIAVAELIIEAGKSGEIERLGIPGSCDPKMVGQAEEVWTFKRMVKAMSMTFNGNLPEEIQDLLSENVMKPPCKIIS